MATAKIMKYKIKEGKKQAWLDWITEMKNRKQEVVDTLINEGVITESCFLSEDGQFVYYYMESEDFEKAKKAVTENPHPIDDDHRKALKDCLEMVSPQECLFYFENRN